MAEPGHAAFEAELHVCSLMIEQIRANARVLFGCRPTYTYDLAVGHGDDGGYRAVLFRHDHGTGTGTGNDNATNSATTAINEEAPPRPPQQEASSSSSSRGHDRAQSGGNGRACAWEGPRRTGFLELRRAHSLLRIGFAPTRRGAVRSVLEWTEGLVSGGGGGLGD